MSDAAHHRRAVARGHSPDIPGRAPPERLALDARRPLRLDGADFVLQVAAGSADLFVQPFAEGRAEGARTHLFRVEAGDLILGLPAGAGEGVAQEIGIVAVGGPGGEVLVLDRRHAVERALIDAWIAQLSAALGGRAPAMRHAGPGDKAELASGERLGSPARDVVWICVERGEVGLMDSGVPWRAGDGPLPVAAGSWVEAGGEEGATVAVLGSADLKPEEIWQAVDRFHSLAILLLRQRLLNAVDSEASRLGRRAELASVQADRIFSGLARIIAPRAKGIVAHDRDIGDPLFAACRAIGDAMGVAMARPAHRRPERRAFRDVADIARMSRLRVRRTLLRADWWRRDAGPLVAWLGEDRQPVAIIPISPRRYVMIEPRSGTRQPVDEQLALKLAPEAATFYRPLPSGSASPLALLRWSARQTGGDRRRMSYSAMALAIIALASPVITAVLVDEVIPRSDLGQLAFCAAALITAAIGTAGFQAVQGVATLRLSGALDWMLQAAVIDRLLRLPVGFFKRYTAGDLADRVLGVEAIRQVLTGRALGGILSGVFCLFSLALMFYYDWQLAFVGVVLTVIHGSVIVAITASRLHHERRHFDLQGKVQGLVLQFLTAIGKLRVAAATMRALGIWSDEFTRQKTHFVASQRAANRLAAFEAAFPTVATLVIFALARGGGEGAQPLDTGQFLAFFAAFGQTLAAIANLGTSIGETLIAVPYFTRMRPVLVEPVEISDLREAPGEISGAVELSQVTFRYIEDAPPILDRLSIQIGKGEYVALVGPSGSGKSTIFRLLLGFEQPQSGTIFYDGRAIDTLDIAAVRRQIGVVLQNGKLVSGSIYDNICGAVQVPIDQAWEAARHAGLDADIDAMPMGMHTVITEGMSTLSGGQKQRLMIARALVHRPRMLLFDEATSALDNRTQAIVSESLSRLNVTRVVIAHRLSTVQDADRIIVLANGAVAQAGSFEELSNSPGLFADLARRQLV